MPLITKEDAVGFLSKTLGIENCEESFVSNKKALLDEICARFLYTIPFHNVSLLNQPLPRRRAPTIEENLKLVLSKEGGLCWTLNSALYCILAAVGYDVTLTLASVVVRNGDNHVVIIVGDTSDGDRRSYLVDVGFGEPAFRAISLDFRQTSETVSESYREYRIVKSDDGLYARVARRVGDRLLDFSGDADVVWEEQYFFRPEPTDLDRLYDVMMTNVWQNAAISLANSPRFIRYVCGRLVAVKGNILLRETLSGEVYHEVLPTDGAIVSAICEFFPEIQKNDVVSVIKGWRSLTK